jgi:hypothetical protein
MRMAVSCSALKPGRGTGGEEKCLITHIPVFLFFQDFFTGDYHLMVNPLLYFSFHAFILSQIYRA